MITHEYKIGRNTARVHKLEKTPEEDAHHQKSIIKAAERFAKFLYLSEKEKVTAAQ